MDFTNAEKERINQLYGNDFEGITPEDASLIGRWEAWKAVNDAEFQAKVTAIEAESKAKLEQSEALHRKAKTNLEELRDAALARLEAIDNGS